MKTLKIAVKFFSTLLVSVFISIIYSHAAFAHCDTVNGPIIPEAQVALEKGDSTPVLKWVKPEYEKEVKAAFAQAQQVRNKGDEAKKLADGYFLETLIRLHRAGEGAPYTGISYALPEEIVILTDKSLVSGTADDVIKEIQNTFATKTREKFNKVTQARKNKDKSVAAGREYVEAYIRYTHYVEGVHAAIESSGEEHHEQGDK